MFSGKLALSTPPQAHRKGEVYFHFLSIKPVVSEKPSNRVIISTNSWNSSRQHFYLIIIENQDIFIKV